MDKIEIGTCKDCVNNENCNIQNTVDDLADFGCAYFQEKEQHTTYCEWVYKKEATLNTVDENGIINAYYVDMKYVADVLIKDITHGKPK